MKKIYFKDMEGNKVTVDVTDEIAQQYRGSLRAEWRNDAYSQYYTVSLDNVLESGGDFADNKPNAEEQLMEVVEREERKAKLKKLKVIIPQLTELQQSTIHKLFVRNMSQSEIAREEGVAQQVVNRRVARIYIKLKQLIEKN